MNSYKFLITVTCIVNWTFALAFPIEKDSTVVTIGSDKVVKIWDKAAHNAFTDLIRFNDAFYCSFREASGHGVKTGQENGKVRVIKSTDGKEWESVALLEKRGIDLRDPKLSVTPEGLLMVIMGGSVMKEGEMLERIPQVSFSGESGSTFSNPKKVIIDPEVKNSWDWIWRVTWNDGVGYAIDWKLQNWDVGDRRSADATGTIYLLKTRDGIYYEEVAYLPVCGFPNESTIRFDENDKMYVVIRREEGDHGDETGVLATASAPYKAWDFRKLDDLGKLGGPNFLFLNDNRLLFASRGRDCCPKTPTYTRLEVTDLKGNRIQTYKLPSGGDNSYPGLVIYKQEVWISYYSSHEGKTAIYLARIPLDQVNLMGLAKEAPDHLTGDVLLVYENNKYNFTGAVQKNPVNGSVSSIWDSGNSHYQIKTPRDLHKVIGHTSTDGGNTYGNEWVVFQSKGSKISYTNPSSGYTLDGRLVCMATKVDQTGEVYPGNPYAMVAKYSDDDGKTWSEEYSIPGILPSWTIMNSNSNIIALGNGALITNYYEGNKGETVNLKCLRSTDNGETWEVLSTIDSDIWSAEGEAINETSMVVIEGNTLLAMTRVNGKSYFNQYLSTNNGVSWVKQGKTSFDDIWPDNGVSSGYVHLIRIASFSLNGEKVIAAYYFNRYEGVKNDDAPFYVVYGKAEDLKDMGIKGWNNETRKEIVTSRNPFSSRDGYPSVIHLNNSLNAYGRFFDDHDNGLQNTTSIIYLKIDNSHKEWLINKLGIQI